MRRRIRTIDSDLANAIGYADARRLSLKRHTYSWEEINAGKAIQSKLDIAMTARVSSYFRNQAHVTNKGETK